MYFKFKEYGGAGGPDGTGHGRGTRHRPGGRPGPRPGGGGSGGRRSYLRRGRGGGGGSAGAGRAGRGGRGRRGPGGGGGGDVPRGAHGPGPDRRPRVRGGGRAFRPHREDERGAVARGGGDEPLRLLLLPAGGPGPDDRTRLGPRRRRPRHQRPGHQPGRGDGGLGMKLSAVNPESLAKPRGYSHGMKGNGDVLFVAGQIGWDRGAVLVSEDLVAQFGQALDNVLDV